MRWFDRNSETMEQQQLLQEGLAELLKTLAENQSEVAVYSDAYGDNETVKVPFEIDTTYERAQHPEIPRVNAVKPRVSTPSSGPVAHAPGNMVVTRDVKNRTRYIHLAGVLRLLAKWLSMDSADRKECVREFINALDAMHLARCKVPFYTAAKGIEVVAARDSSVRPE